MTEPGHRAPQQAPIRSNRNFFTPGRRGRGWLAGLAAGLALTTSLATPPARPSPTRPNIVILLADDLGYGDLGSYGATRIKTPHLDRLAAEGMRFTDAHAPAAVCIPSRYGLLTGRYPFRNHGNPNQGPVIEEGRPTLASLLKSRGYTTAMVGKWHLGFERGISFDYARPLRGGPVDRGFDSFFGIHASTDITPYFYIRDDHAVMAPTEAIAAGSTPGWSPIQGAFWRSGPVSPDLKLHEVLPRFTHEAINWLDRQVKDAPRQPFLLYVAFTAPHTPWLPNADFKGQSAADMYGDFVMQLDESVGRILAALERLGEKDNTLVLFTSDNGPVWYAADVQRLGHSASGSFRGMKGDTWEAGHRLPFIARWPGRIAPGSVNDTVISHVDIFATLADLTGTTMPTDAAEDSFSFLPTLLGRAGPERPPVITLSSQGKLTIREGPWKLIPSLGSGGFSQPNREAAVPGGPTGQLYNLSVDPGEQHNLWQEQPELVARLARLLEKYQGAGRTRL